MFNAKIKFLGRHWKELILSALKTTIVGFGMVITFSDALLNVLPKETEYSRPYMLLYHLVHLPFEHPSTLIVAVLILMLIGLIINWPKTKAVYKDASSDLRVIVECCDLFSQQGMRVIHCVDTFDTALGTVISPRSVHGAFLQKCKENNFDIDKAITEGLRFQKPVATDDTLPANRQRYQLGTVCPVTLGSDTYCMVSFTHLQANGSIAITRKEYTEFLLAMWHNLSTPTLRQDEVNVAVMGNRFVDLPAEFSTEQKIDLMIQTFFMAAREKACCRTLRICVHESNMSEVDFPHYATIIDHLAKRPMM